MPHSARDQDLDGASKKRHSPRIWVYRMVWVSVCVPAKGGASGLDERISEVAQACQSVCLTVSVTYVRREKRMNKVY